MKTPSAMASFPAPPKAAPAAAAQDLLLELVVNERRTGVIAAVHLDRGRFRLALVDLKRAGLVVGAQGTSLFLDELPGIAARYDAPLQQLRLDAASDYFPSQRVGPKTRAFVPASYDMGALLNYDVYVSGGGARRRLRPGTKPGYSAAPARCRRPECCGAARRKAIFATTPVGAVRTRRLQ
jgi:outer membrane usher protein FimD/PapC